MKIYFVRHGQSEANEAGIVADSSPKLTLKGIEQAERTGRELKDMNIAKVVSSTYVRAQQTAEIIAGEIGLGLKDIELLEELKERGMGECEGKPKDLDNASFFTFDTERGFEAQADLIERLVKALEVIMQKFGSENIVVVGHAVSGYYFQQVIKGYRKFSDFEDYKHMKNADYIEIEI